jgi:putative ABC transport system ATP-binding protein
MLKVDKLQFQYTLGEFRLDIPSFQIRDGRSVALIGPSGIGKTTLLHLISGVLSPDSGSVEVNGENLETMSEPKRRGFRLSKIGFIFQDFELLPYLSVRENILLPARLGSTLILNREMRMRAEDLARMTGIEPLLNRRPERLSKGERQRTAVCRALLSSPALILADEATGNLDPDNRDKVWDILDTYRAESGATILAATHDHEMLDRFDEHHDIRDLSSKEAER